MNVFKAAEIPVYDNLYCKPSQMGVPLNARFSMVVLFAVDDVIYYGQYDFTTGLWGTLPGDENKRSFEDRVVQYWFYAPGSIDLFQKYAADVRRGRCVDGISRLDEYAKGVDIKE